MKVRYLILIVMLLMMPVATMTEAADYYDRYPLLEENKDYNSQTGTSATYKMNLNFTDEVLINFSGSANRCFIIYDFSASYYTGHTGTTWVDIGTLYPGGNGASVLQDTSTCKAGGYTTSNNFTFRAPYTGMFVVRAITSGANAFTFNISISSNVVIPEVDLDALRDELIDLIEDLNNTINAMDNNISSMNVAINELLLQLNSLDIYISSEISMIWQTIANINDTDESLIENITKLHDELNLVQNEISELEGHIKNLNLTEIQNITEVQNNITNITNEVYEIHNHINQTNLTAVKELNARVDATEKNVTTMKEAIPDDYNDTDLKQRIAYLEGENERLSNEVKNNTETKVIEQVQDNTNSNIGIGMGAIALGIGILSFSRRKTTAQSEEGSTDEDIWQEIDDEEEDIPKARATKTEKKKS